MHIFNLSLHYLVEIGLRQENKPPDASAKLTDATSQRILFSLKKITKSVPACSGIKQKTMEGHNKWSNLLLIPISKTSLMINRH